MNIICGPNGIGKTTVLESIAHCFTYGATNVLKRHVGAANSKISASLMNGTNNHRMEINFKEYEPNKSNNISGYSDKSHFLLSLKTTYDLRKRNFQSFLYF